MCLNPLKGFISPETKQICKVTKSDVKAVRYDDTSGKWFKYYSDDFPSDSLTEFCDLPCRSCEQCYADMRRHWISRAVAESTQHDKMIFITLTYNDCFIPYVEVPDLETGELFRHNTLYYRDFQLFMKKLRKEFDYSIRYMVCGEYGSKRFRPHYHAIIFGIGLDDLGLCIPHTKNSSGDVLFQSNFIDKLWNKGYCLVSEANTKTIAYVAGYVCKKAVSPADKSFYKNTGVVAPFIKASNRPGLGCNWFTQNIDRFKDIYDYVSVPTATDPVKIFLTENWKFKKECQLIGNMNGLNEVIEYSVSKANRRYKLLDNRFSLLNTDMSKEQYNSSLSHNFRKSWERKRGLL